MRYDLPKRSCASAAVGCNPRRLHSDKEREMPIGTVIHKNDYLFIYDKGGRQISMVPVGVGNSELLGYTETTVSVRRGNYIYTYNEQGRQLGMTQGPMR
jgi:hypothetical protein